MKTSSRKSKGRNLQNWCRDLLYKLFPKLEFGDIKTAVMGESGADIVLSPAARRLIPLNIECKNQEKISIWSAYKQARSHGDNGEPLLIIKRNRHSPLAVVDAEYFFELLRKANGKR